jgi:hypothetical protein
LQEPVNFEAVAPSPDELLDDELLELLEDELLDDELLDDESSSASPPLPLDDRSFDGSSYSTGFMRGPQAMANTKTPKVSETGRMLGRFTGKLLGDDCRTSHCSDGQPSDYLGRLPHRKRFQTPHFDSRCEPAQKPVTR